MFMQRRWIDHFYMKNFTIWDLNLKKDFSLFIKRLLSIQDKLITVEGSVAAARLDAWLIGGSFNTSTAYA